MDRGYDAVKSRQEYRADFADVEEDKEDKDVCDVTDGFVHMTVWN